MCVEPNTVTAGGSWERASKPWTSSVMIFRIKRESRGLMWSSSKRRSIGRPSPSDAAG